MYCFVIEVQVRDVRDEDLSILVCGVLALEQSCTCRVFRDVGSQHYNNYTEYNNGTVTMS